LTGKNNKKMSDNIRGKVAKVLNSHEVALNVGTQNGVEIGMCFDILDSKGENIVDPDSQEVLGSINRPKVRVKVIKVQKNLSVASTFKEKKKNIGGTLDFGNLGAISQSLMPQKWVSEVETLKTEEKTWEDIEEEQSYVKTGDPIVQVNE
tara:strand:- start:17193 stop:17642 length:450 start_codon:yes stop_codon:yes gene_type:complete